MPASTRDSRNWMFCTSRINDTVTGVSGGVSPKTCVPGRSAGLTPEGTDVGAFGPGEAEAGADNTTMGVMATTTPSTIPIDNVAFLMNTMSCALLVKLCSKAASNKVWHFSRGAGHRGQLPKFLGHVAKR